MDGQKKLDKFYSKIITYLARFYTHHTQHLLKAQPVIPIYVPEITATVAPRALSGARSRSSQGLRGIYLRGSHLG